MKLELHMIQNFAPSCLNRDDTNAPKDCDFGGFRRARISSQCIKRTIRTSPIFKDALEHNLGVRTKLLVKMLSDKLKDVGIDAGEVEMTVPMFVSSYCGIDKENKTKVLLYLGNDELERMAATLRGNWPKMARAAEEAAAEAEDNKGKKGKAIMSDKAKQFAELAKEAAGKAVGATRAVDIALFGRMVAESPTDNIDAACQVAHAISTHRVNMEMDFYTAVDDISNETGAGMMGTVEFNSACFYRYSVLDFDQLLNNLGGDRELARLAVEAFLRALVRAIPTGKQTSTAAHNPPSLVMAVVRQSGAPQSLANAFEQPVLPRMGENGGLVVKSIERLDRYWDRLTSMYGQDGVKVRPVCVLDEVKLSNLGDQAVRSIEELAARVMGALE
ncbi:MAG: type I-E CRISPR-associated protein Cas7/Cse4/CasC [Actinobacteria bacterium]|nr:type I-E CRISPR-associated protein Cas7/Cse4/CasC [Actinomycetota bacterium]